MRRKNPLPTGSEPPDGRIRIPFTMLPKRLLLLSALLMLCLGAFGRSAAPDGGDRRARAERLDAASRLDAQKRLALLGTAVYLRERTADSLRYVATHLKEVFMDSLRVRARKDIAACDACREQFDAWKATLSPQGRDAVETVLICTNDTVPLCDPRYSAVLVNTGEKRIIGVNFSHEALDTSGRCVYSDGEPVVATLSPGSLEMDRYDCVLLDLGLAAETFRGTPVRLVVNTLEVTFGDGTVVSLDGESARDASSCPVRVLEMTGDGPLVRLESRFRMLPEELWRDDALLQRHFSGVKASLTALSTRWAEVCTVLDKMMAAVKAGKELPLKEEVYRKAFHKVRLDDPPLLKAFDEYTVAHAAYMELKDTQ